MRQEKSEKNIGATNTRDVSVVESCHLFRMKIHPLNSFLERTLLTKDIRERCIWRSLFQDTLYKTH